MVLWILRVGIIGLVAYWWIAEGWCLPLWFVTLGLWISVYFSRFMVAYTLHWSCFTTLPIFSLVRWRHQWHCGHLHSATLLEKLLKVCSLSDWSFVYLLKIDYDFDLLAQFLVRCFLIRLNFQRNWWLAYYLFLNFLKN